jgi:hypothetical protein
MAKSNGKNHTTKKCGPARKAAKEKAIIAETDALLPKVRRALVRVGIGGQSVN